MLIIMNKLNDLLDEILKNEILKNNNDIKYHIDEIKKIINTTTLKPYEYYKKFNNELIFEDYELIKLRLLHENDVEIDDYLNINCNNCSNCKLCYKCDDCNNCDNCDNCDNCNNCHNCNNCYNCKKCNKCDDCNDCSDCNDCYNCDNCLNCNDCSICNNCHNCNNHNN